SSASCPVLLVVESCPMPPGRTAPRRKSLGDPVEESSCHLCPDNAATGSAAILLPAGEIGQCRGFLDCKVAPGRSMMSGSNGEEKNDDRHPSWSPGENSPT